MFTLYVHVSAEGLSVCYCLYNLSEPHIDCDNVPRRGECLYVSGTYV